MKNKTVQQQALMSVADYRAFKLSGTDQARELEQNVCAALQKRVNEADICDKYGLTQSILVVIKEDNGLIFRGPLAGASAETIAARKLYERQCRAKSTEPLAIKEWRWAYEESLKLTGSEAEQKADLQSFVQNVEQTPENLKPKQLPLNFDKIDTKYEHDSPQHLENIRYNLSVNFLQMLCDHSRLAGVLQSLADELCGKQSGSLTIVYSAGKLININHDLSYEDR